MSVTIPFEIRRPMAAHAIHGGRRERVAAWAVVAVGGRVVGDRGSYAIEVVEAELVVDAAHLSDRVGD